MKFNIRHMAASAPPARYQSFVQIFDLAHNCGSTSAMTICMLPFKPGMVCVRIDLAFNKIPQKEIWRGGFNDFSGFSLVLVPKYLINDYIEYFIMEVCSMLTENRWAKFAPFL